MPCGVIYHPNSRAALPRYLGLSGLQSHAIAGFDVCDMRDIADLLSPWVLNASTPFGVGPTKRRVMLPITKFTCNNTLTFSEEVPSLNTIATSTIL